MSGPNHAAGGFILTGLYLSMFDINVYSQPAYIGFTLLFSLLPDIDHTKSIIGKMCYPLAKYLDRKFGHRTITHSLLFYFIGILIVGIIERTWFNSKVITSIFIWAYGSHLILDMLTVQGVPLFYPFKKNPCVIPGNPKYRLKSSEFKTEAAAFFLFVMLSFTTKDLFAKGFWNSFNSVFHNVKSIHRETLLSDSAILVKYDINQDGKEMKGSAFVVNSSTDKLLIYDSAKGFLNILTQDRTKYLQPVRTGFKREIKGFEFAGISVDSLHSLTKGKAILELKLQTELPIYYTKDNAPQAGTSVSLENVSNPLFRSNDIDSTDQSAESQISLLQMQLEEEKEKQRFYQKEKQMFLAAYAANQSSLNSDDLAEREKAIQQQAQVKRDLEGLQKPFDNSPALIVRLNYLKGKLKVSRKQKITGFMKWVEWH